MLIGHQRIWEYLVKSANNNKLAHAYLFVGQPQLGKKTLAINFAQWLVCEKNGRQDNPCGACASCLSVSNNQNPDVLIIGPRQEEKKSVTRTYEIGIEEIKNLQHRLSLSSYRSTYKIGIIDEISWLTEEAANAFLKTLEEPSGRSLIFLTSSSWQGLLSTIVSRCQMIKFALVPSAEISRGLEKLNFGQTRAKKIVKMSVGRPGRAINLAADAGNLAAQEKKYKILGGIFSSDLPTRFDFSAELSQDVPAALDLLDQWQLWLRDQLLRKSGAEELILNGDENLKLDSQKLLQLMADIKLTQKILFNPSINAKLALEVLMTKI